MGDDELLSRLGNDVRLAEISAKDEMMRSLTRRMEWIWAGFALCWVALALWLLSAVRSRRRYRDAARDRQQAVESMERAIVAKRKFLSMVSHEVRSPLQNIVASAELLAMKDNRPESIAAIRRIRHAVSVLQGQLRDLLTIARGDAGQWAMQVETFEFGGLVRDVCAELEETAHAKGLAFAVEIPEAPLTVNADPIRIAQVLRNLVENAVRYTNTGGIEVRLEPFDRDGSSAKDSPAADTSPMPGWVRFSVEDSGPGLPPQALQRLQGATVPFESSSDGSGIGLFVIRDVLQQLGGQIDVQSTITQNPEGRGTTFKVSIPALILISAAENQAVGLTWPFDGFLQKPIDCQALSRLIGSRTYPNPLLPGPADAGGQGGIERPLRVQLNFPCRPEAVGRDRPLTDASAIAEEELSAIARAPFQLACGAFVEVAVINIGIECPARRSALVGENRD